MTIRSRDPGQDCRILINEFLKIRCIFRNQLLQRGQNPHTSIFNNLCIIQKRTHKNIRILIACPHKTFFLIISFGCQNICKIQFDIRHLLIFFPHIHGIPFGLNRTLLSKNTKREFFIYNRKTFFIQIIPICTYIEISKHSCTYTSCQ